MARAPAKLKPAPARPPELPQGRWLGDLQAIKKLTTAEERLLHCCAKGEAWKPVGWNRKRPDEATPANTIRADLVRFLALGGDTYNPVHEASVVLFGGWIRGALDMHHCKAQVRLFLMHCEFDCVPILVAASLPELTLTGSRVPGLNADHLAVAGTINLDDGFEAQGEVRLLGATIGGDLACPGGKFCVPEGDALSGDRMSVAGSVFLRDGFKAQGEVRLHGATIGGSLECTSGTFIHPDGGALCGNSMTVARGVMLHHAVFRGAISFAGARVGVLIDDADCWKHGDHILDGLRYDRIIGPLNAPGRIAWLRSQRDDHLSGSEFRPQPWEQLIKVLREMGHSGEAAEVAIAKQDAMARAGRIGQRQVKSFEGKWLPRLRVGADRIWNPLANSFSRGWHRLYGLLSGYGYRPVRIVYLTALLVCLSSLALYEGRHDGLIGPTDPLIHLSKTTEACGTGGDPGAIHWTDPKCPVPPEYSTFQPFFYALDVTLPLVDLHQEVDWGPLVTNSNGDVLWGGRALRWLMWFDIIFGWLASLMFVAIVSRLVDKD